MRILIGVDGSQAADVACEFVANRTWPIDTRIDLVGVVPRELIRRDRITVRDALIEEISNQADSLRNAGISLSTEVIDGDPAQSLSDRAGSTFADLIVVGNRGRGPLGSAVMGSVSASLIDHAPCPVLVVRSPWATRMVLASDGTTSSLRIPRDSRGVAARVQRHSRGGRQRRASRRLRHTLGARRRQHSRWSPIRRRPLTRRSPNTWPMR